MDGGRPEVEVERGAEQERRKEGSKLAEVRPEQTSQVQGRRQFGMCCRGVRWCERVGVRSGLAASFERIRVVSVVSNEPRRCLQRQHRGQRLGQQ